LLIEQLLDLLVIALAASMAARAFTKERLPFGIAARLRLFMQNKVIELSAASSRASFIVGEIHHLLSCPLCVSFWIIGAWLFLADSFAIDYWMAATGAAWMFGRAMGWENYPDNEV